MRKRVIKKGETTVDDGGASVRLMKGREGDKIIMKRRKEEKKNTATKMKTRNM